MVRWRRRWHVVPAMNATTTPHISLHAVPADQSAGAAPAPCAGRVLNLEDLRRCMPRMRARARSLVRSREDAEDLVQDTLVYVLRRPRVVANEDPTGYLLRAIRNMWISQHRRRRLEWPESLDERHEALAGAGPDPTACIAEEFAWSAVKALPDPYRDVVVAVVLCGFSYRDAADALGVPIGTIMSRLYRARRLLEPAIREAA
jgi:RNA polymerase sigma-70 factor (ECF subfamily)